MLGYDGWYETHDGYTSFMFYSPGLTQKSNEGAENRINAYRPASPTRINRAPYNLLGQPLTMFDLSLFFYIHQVLPGLHFEAFRRTKIVGCLRKSIFK